jgi:hypothetical protein
MGIQAGQYSAYNNLTIDTINESNEVPNNQGLWLRIRWDADGGTESAGLITYDYSVDGIGWTNSRGGSDAARSVGDIATELSFEGIYEIGFFVKSQASDGRILFLSFRTSSDISDTAMIPASRADFQRSA